MAVHCPFNMWQTIHNHLYCPGVFYQIHLPQLWEEVGIVFLDWVSIIVPGDGKVQLQSPKKAQILQSFSTGSLLSSLLSTTPADVILCSKRKSLILPLKSSNLCSPAMTSLLPYDTQQEEKISNSFLERLQYEKAGVPLQWPFCFFTPTSLSLSVFTGLE